jgi:dephospho-CoA kinase
MGDAVTLIGLSGTNGSGKDTVAHMLVERHGFLFAGASEMFVIELKKRGWPIDREHKSKLSAEWRREFGLAVVVDKALEMYHESPGKYRGLVVGSLRHPAEADRVHELGGKVVWADADPKVRYKRITSGNRGRADEDNKTFEEFLAEEEREMHRQAGADDATLNMAAVKDRVDVFLMNDGTNIEAFKDYADKTLGIA